MLKVLTAAHDTTPAHYLQTSLQPDCLFKQVPTPFVNPFINLASTQLQPSYLFKQLVTPSPNPLVNLASTQLRIGRFFELVPILSCNPFIIFSHINLKLLCNQVANLLQPFLNVSDVHCVPLRNTRFTIYWEQSSSSTIFYSQTSTTSPSQHTSVANQNCQQSLAATPTTNPLTTTL